MDDGEVALQAGQDVEEQLAHGVGEEQEVTDRESKRHINGGAHTGEQRAANAHYLNDDHVVGEDVGVAHGPGRLRPPSLETQPQDEDVEWEEEDEADDSEDFRVEGSSCGLEAEVQFGGDAPGGGEGGVGSHDAHCERLREERKMGENNYSWLKMKCL